MVGTLPEPDLDTKPAAPWQPDDEPGRESESPPDARPGAQVGRYTVLEKVGAGGMGVVYRAEDPELRRDVALKLLRPRRAFGKQAEQHRARLLREARAMAKLAHPNVIRVYDVGMHGDGMFVAMEYVQGEDALRWLRRERPGWRRVLGVYRAAGRGLAAAHDAGMVHRDFKPANVHVGDDGRVRVLDFGLARAVEIESSDDDDDDDFAWSPQVTRVGSVVGTPVYMAPEQFAGLPPDPRSDQYAFCIALYESLFGVPPFPGRTPRQIARAKLDLPMGTPPADTDVPAALVKVIERGLAVEPSRRFAKMPDVLRALRAIAEAQDGVPASATQRWRRWAVAGGLAAVVGTAWLVGAQSSGGNAACEAAANADIASFRRAYFDAVAEGAARRAAEAAIVLAERWSGLQCAAKSAEWRAHARAQLQAAGRPAALEARLAGLGS